MEAETFEAWRNRQTRSTLLLWQQGLLSTHETWQTLYKLSWKSGEVEKLMQGAYLLLSIA